MYFFNIKAKFILLTPQASWSSQDPMLHMLHTLHYIMYIMVHYVRAYHFREQNI